MATFLRDLVIEKVALVDEGSCSDAHIKLFKRKTEGGKSMKLDEILKSLPQEQQDVVKQALADAKAELPEGAASAEDKKKLEDDLATAMAKNKTLEDEVAKAKQPQQSEEEILKNADLDPALKALVESSINKAKAAEAAIVKMREEKLEAEYIGKAKEVNFIPEADTKVVALLKSIGGVEGAVEATMDILKSANELISKGQMFQEVGANGDQGSLATGNAEAAWGEIEKAAKELVVKGQVSESKAIEMAIEQNPALYNAYVDALR